jgi:putative transcriptional regulator
MKPEAGKLLVATPRLSDPYFSGGIVFLTEYSEAGAQGIIINGRTVGMVALGDMMEIGDLPSDMDHTDEDGNPSAYAQAQREEFLERVLEKSDKEPLHVGGPCQTPLYVIHGHPNLHVTDPKRELAPGILFALPPDVISVVENTKADERKLLFYMGVSGWYTGQLEREIQEGAWTVQDAHSLSDVIWTPDRLREFVGFGPITKSPFSMN